MTCEVNLDLADAISIISTVADAPILPDLDTISDEALASNPRASQRRLRTELRYQGSQAFLKPIPKKNTGAGSLSKRKVSVLTPVVKECKNNINSKLIVCAKKVDKKASGNWFGFVVGAVMMIAGAVVTPIAPVAAGVLIPCGFGFMMNEAINAGNGINF